MRKEKGRRPDNCVCKVPPGTPAHALLPAIADQRLNARRSCRAVGPSCENTNASNCLCLVLESAGRLQSRVDQRKNYPRSVPECLRILRRVQERSGAFLLRDSRRCTRLETASENTHKRSPRFQFGPSCIDQRPRSTTEPTQCIGVAVLRCYELGRVACAWRMRIRSRCFGRSLEVVFVE